MVEQREKNTYKFEFSEQQAVLLVALMGETKLHDVETFLHKVGREDLMDLVTNDYKSELFKMYWLLRKYLIKENLINKIGERGINKAIKNINMRYLYEGGEL